MKHLTNLLGHKHVTVTIFVTFCIAVSQVPRVRKSAFYARLSQCPGSPDIGPRDGRVGLEKDLNQISIRIKQGQHACKYYDNTNGRTDGRRLHKKKHVRPV